MKTSKSAVSLILCCFIVAMFAATNHVKAETASLATIQSKGKLIVGTDIPYGIMEFFDKKGNPAGIDMDIGKEIAKRIGVTMEVETMSFDKLFSALTRGKVDVVISAVTITPERQKKMLFSVPYLNAGMFLAVRKSNWDITSLETLKNKRVGVLKGTIGEQLAIKSPHIEAPLIKRYTSNDRRLQDLRDGKVDAIIIHFLVTDLPDIKRVGEPLSESYYGVVTRLSSQSLMNEINKTLRYLKRNGALARIKKKYAAAAKK